MKMLAVASEAFPLIKTGGLADVVGTLPAALNGLGIEMRTKAQTSSCKRDGPYVPDTPSLARRWP